MGVSLPISLKQSVEVCREIRGKQITRAVYILTSVIEGKESIAFKRYNKGGVGHRVGKGPGRMPIKTCTEIVALLRSAKANAENKGLNANALFVHSALAKKAPTTRHYLGRRSRRFAKRAHVEIVLEEKEIKTTTKFAHKKVTAQTEQKTVMTEKEQLTYPTPAVTSPTTSPTTASTTSPTTPSPISSTVATKQQANQETTQSSATTSSSDATISNDKNAEEKQVEEQETVTKQEDKTQSTTQEKEATS